MSSSTGRHRVDRATCDRGRATAAAALRGPTRSPCLKHQDRPEFNARVAPAFLKIVPASTDSGAVEEPILFQLALRQQVARPLPEGASQPSVDRHRKAHLRTLEEVPRDAAVGN